VDNAETTEFSEITILPDGRLYVFGLTRPLLELLATLPAENEPWRELLSQATDDPDRRVGDKS